VEVRLLRELIDDALNTLDEKSRIESFWVFAPDYDECLPIFKEIFLNKKMNKIENEECTITKIEHGFLVEDPSGNHDIFTNAEVSLFINLWEKAQKVKPTIIERSLIVR
jgi:hypothetical protein